MSESYSPKAGFQLRVAPEGQSYLKADAPAGLGSGIVIALDVRRGADGTPSCYSHGATEATGRDLVEWAVELEEHGAGEILLSAVDQDGRMQGYDLALIRSVSEAVGIPIIASCGAGSYAHLLEAVSEGGASAVAAASIFHFTELTPDGARRYLAAAGLEVRTTWRP